MKSIWSGLYQLVDNWHYISVRVFDGIQSHRAILIANLLQIRGNKFPKHSGTQKRVCIKAVIRTHTNTVEQITRLHKLFRAADIIINIGLCQTVHFLRFIKKTDAFFHHMFSIRNGEGGVPMHNDKIILTAEFTDQFQDAYVFLYFRMKILIKDAVVMIFFGDGNIQFGNIPPM